MNGLFEKALGISTPLFVKGLNFDNSRKRLDIRDGPQFLDSSLSEISARHYAAFFAMGLAQYTASGVCRFNAW